MVEVTPGFLKVACKKHLNILDKVKDIQADNFVHLGLAEQDEFFEISLGLIYQATRTGPETFRLWAVRNNKLVALVGIEGSPWGIFVVHFEGTAQW